MLPNFRTPPHTLAPTHSGNLLYPKEDRTSRTLEMFCKQCEHTAEAEEGFEVVYQRQVIKTAECVLVLSAAQATAQHRPPHPPQEPPGQGEGRRGVRPHPA